MAPRAAISKKEMKKDSRDVTQQGDTNEEKHIRERQGNSFAIWLFYSDFKTTH